MSLIDHETFSIGQDQFRSDPVQLATLESVTIYRAKFLDDLIGNAIVPKFIPVPSDIDDLEVPDSVILNVLQDDNLTAQDRAQKVIQAMKERSANNPLNWQNAIKRDYVDNLGKFVSGLRSLYINKSSKVFQENLSDDKLFSDAVISQDVTRFCSLGEIVCDIEFGNEAPFTLSIQGMQEAKQNGTLKFIPRETDVVEIIVRYPNNTLVTEFLGIIFSISYQESYGQNTIIPMMAYGLSKLLMINKMVTDRGLVSQFEDGDLAQAGVTPWDTNQFANNSIDEIFNFIMINELGMKPTNNPGSIGSEKASATFELGVILDTVIPALNKQATDLSNDIGPTNAEITDHIIADAKKSSQDMNDDNLPTNGVFIRDNLEQTILDTQAVSGRKSQFDLAFSQKDTNDPNFQHNESQAFRLAAIKILISRLNVRTKTLNEQIKILSKATTNPEDLSIDYQFDARAFNDPNAFNLIYIPIMTIAMVRLHQSFTTAKFHGRQSFAFDLAIRGGFKVFFSQMQYPNEIFNAIRQTAKHVIYENERNQIIAEIPRYNDFSADDGELLSDFVITNASPTINRQDLSLKTRQDVKEYIPFVGPSPAESLSSGHFTDPAVLARYGMRADDPILNPNAVKGLTFSFASIELTNANAMTRTMSIDPPANHSYKVGRLYFVARKYAETTIGEPSGQISNNMDGYVGYTVKRSLTISQGNVVAFHLIMHYVRKSRLVINPDHLDRFAANFKLLPDIGGLIDALETARVQGELSDEDMRQDTPALPPPKDVAETIQFPGGEVYVTDNISFSRDRLPTGSLLAPLLSKKTIFSNQIESNPDTILLDGGINKVFGPVQDSLPYIIDIDNGKVPVAVKTDLDGGISKAMAITLNMLDLRIRSLNDTIFPGKNIVYPSGQNFFNGNWHHTFPTTFGLSVTDKVNMWTPLYIPTQTINPNYRINILRGWSFYALQTVASSSALKGATKFFPAGGFGTPGGGLLGDDVSRCSIVAGPPIDVSSGLVPAVVILQFDNEPTNITKTITIGGIPVTFYNSATLKTPSNISVLQSQLTAVMNDFGISSGDQATLSGNLTQELNNVPSTLSSTLLPVLFIPPSANVLATTDPGISISVLDITTYSPVSFPAQIDFQETGNASALHTEHSKGDAVDFTLAPYYAISGYALSAHNPYILSSDYPNLKGSQSNPTHLQLVFFKSLLRIGNTAHPTPIFKFPITITPKSDANAQAGIQSIFDTIISKNGFPFSFDITKKLQPNDQSWYHIAAMNPLP